MTDYELTCLITALVFILNVAAGITCIVDKRKRSRHHHHVHSIKVAAHRTPAQDFTRLVVLLDITIAVAAGVILACCTFLAITK